MPLTRNAGEAVDSSFSLHRAVSQKDQEFEGSYKEWASRIRSTQADIDKQEEGEQLRLRQEIERARQARRSRQASSSFASPPYCHPSGSSESGLLPQSPASPTPAPADGTMSRPLPIRPGSSDLLPRADLSDSLANQNDAIKYSAAHRPDPSAGPVGLAQFMGARKDVNGPVLTKQRVAEEEVRPEGWEAAEKRAAAMEGKGGLAGFLTGGAAARPLPGMVSQEKLDADRAAQGPPPGAKRPLPMGPPARAASSSDDQKVEAQQRKPLSLADRLAKDGVTGSKASSLPSPTSSPQWLRGSSMLGAQSPSFTSSLPRRSPTLDAPVAVASPRASPTLESSSILSVPPSPRVGGHSPNVFEMARSRSPAPSLSSESLAERLSPRPVSPVPPAGSAKSRSRSPMCEPAPAPIQPASTTPDTTPRKPSWSRPTATSADPPTSTPPETKTPRRPSWSRPTATPTNLVSPALQRTVATTQEEKIAKPLTASLSRLAGSNIVAQRVQWSNKQAATAPPPSNATPPLPPHAEFGRPLVSPVSTSATTPAPAPVPAAAVDAGALKGHQKKNSVFERWGRDLPNRGQTVAASAAATPARKWEPLAPSASGTSSTTKNEMGVITGGPNAGTGALGSVTRGRVKGPQKTTARKSGAGLAPASAPVSASRDAAPQAQAPKQLPRASSPSPGSRVAHLTAPWQASGPIGTKPSSLPRSNSASSRPLPVPPPESNPGPPRSGSTPVGRVALPGMTPPSRPRQPTPSPKLQAQTLVPPSGDQDLLDYVSRQIADIPPFEEDSGHWSGGEEMAPAPARHRRVSSPGNALSRPESRSPAVSPGRKSRRASRAGTPVKRAKGSFPLPPIGALPRVNVVNVLRAWQAPPRYTFGAPVSTEVFSVTGTGANAIDAANAHQFYVAETIATVHRHKSGGLAATTVFVWRGRGNVATQAIEEKLAELCDRYRASPIEIRQGSEPPELVALLGGLLVIRPGARRYFDPLNTTISRAHWLITEKGEEVVVMDDVPFEAASLASGHAAVVSVLDDVFVWIGSKAPAVEAKAAQRAAQDIANRRRVTLLPQGEESDYFRSVFGEEGYASSNLWRHQEYLHPIPRVWRVDAKAKEAVTHASAPATTGISLVDTGLELFVLVPAEVRHLRTDAALAIRTAGDLSDHLSDTSQRPLRVPVHVLIFPTIVPAELAVIGRAFDFAALNGGDVPERMNLLSFEEALEQLGRRSVEGDELADETYLPLGVGPRTD